MFGGSGHDYIFERISAEIEHIDGGDGDDYIFTSGGTDRTIIGGAGNDVIRGGPQIPARENADQLGDGVSDGGAGQRHRARRRRGRLRPGRRRRRHPLRRRAASIASTAAPGNDAAVVENALEGSLASTLGCERIVMGDPSVTDASFDGLFGTPHAGKATGTDG